MAATLTTARSSAPERQGLPTAARPAAAAPVRSAPARRPEPSARLDHLDALRGLAAVVVLAHHALLALAPGKSAATWSPFNIVLLGRPAVILFFVLSGFVLTLHLNMALEGYRGFAVRRLIRLSVPYAAAIAMAFAAFTLVPRHEPTGLSPWLDAQWQGDLGVVDLLRHLALLAGPRQFPLDHVAWSLVHELRLSLALPVFLIGLRRLGPWVMLAAAGGTSLLADTALATRPVLVPAGLYGLLFDADDPVVSLILTLRFCFAIALGAVLAGHGAALAGLMRRPLSSLAGLVLGWGLLSARNEAAMALGSTVLIAAATWGPPLATALRVRPLLWLGSISFSLYLVHLPVMLTCTHVLRGHGPAWAGLLTGIVLAIPLAAGMARWVEEPSIRWSRAAARLLSRPSGRDRPLGWPRGGPERVPCGLGLKRQPVNDEAGLAG